METALSHLRATGFQLAPTHPYDSFSVKEGFLVARSPWLPDYTYLGSPTEKQQGRSYMGGSAVS